MNTRIFTLIMAKKIIRTPKLIRHNLDSVITSHLSLYSLIWDFLLVQINTWTTTTWSNVWVVLPKTSWYEFLIGFLDMNTCFKVFASYNILQNLCDFIHVLKFVIVSKCRKSPKLTNIVIPMVGENWQLVTNEPVELRNNRLKFKTPRNLPIILVKFMEYTPT